MCLRMSRHPALVVVLDEELARAAGAAPAPRRARGGAGPEPPKAAARLAEQPRPAQAASADDDAVGTRCAPSSAAASSADQMSPLPEHRHAGDALALEPGDRLPVGVPE